MLDMIIEVLPEVTSWLIRIAAFIIIPFRRSPDAARAWLLLFFVAPWIALPLYVLIGRPRHSPERCARFEELPDILEHAFEPVAVAPPSDECGSDVTRATETLIRSLCRLPPQDGNTIELMPDYDASIARLITDIDAAQAEILLEYYIFADDETGGCVVDALERATTRGVQCRVLMDALGSWSWTRKLDKRLKRANIPLVRQLPLTRRWRSSRLDLRNHRKIAVIDGRVAHTGSQNLIDARSATGLPNRELVVRVEGPAVLALHAVFIGDWYLDTGEVLERHTHEETIIPKPDVNALSDVRVQVLPSGPDYPGGGVDTLFTSLIHDATCEVVLVSPYFIPNRPLAQALAAAALAGVEVTLILSKQSDSEIVAQAQEAWYEQLLESGVQIRLHRDEFLHAKHLRIDDRFSVIGSSNMDLRSFELNAEISLILYGRPTAHALANVERDLLDCADTLELDTWRQRSLPRKLLQNSARLFSDLL